MSKPNFHLPLADLETAKPQLTFTSLLIYLLFVELSVHQVTLLTHSILVQAGLINGAFMNVIWYLRITTSQGCIHKIMIREGCR